MNKHIDLQLLIRRALFLFSISDELRHPPVLNSQGLPARITRLREDSGFDANLNGITLSIFPFDFGATTTVTTQNAAQVFEHYHTGSGQQSVRSFDRCKVALVVRLSTTGANRPKSVISNNNFNIEFQTNELEAVLRSWSHVIRQMLLSEPFSNIDYLARNSHVNSIKFPTTAWSEKDSAVLHSVELLWQIEINMPRNWKETIRRDPYSGQPTWIYYGMETRTKRPVYIDKETGLLVTNSGNYLRTTPSPLNRNLSPIPVIYDFTNARLERYVPGSSPNSGAALTPTELLEPGETYPWISTNMVLVGYFTYTNKRVYWNTLTNRLEYDDFTPVTTIPFGDPSTTADDIIVSYDHNTRTFTLTFPNGSQLIIGPSNTPSWNGPIVPIGPNNPLPPNTPPGVDPGNIGGGGGPGGGSGYPQLPIIVFPVFSSQIAVNIWQANFVYLVESLEL